MDQEYPSSDSSDEEYIPSDGEKGSEEEESGDEEDLEGITNEGDDVGKGKRRKKPAIKPRCRKGGLTLPPEDEKDAHNLEGDNANPELALAIKEEKAAQKAEEEKAKSDRLWADFMQDVKTTPKPTSAPATKTAPQPSVSTPTTIGTAKKVTITKEFDFAGEIVTVTKEVDVNSAEAKQVNRPSPKVNTPSATSAPSPGLLSPGIKRPAAAVGGLNGLLGKIDKKPKISVLDKSKMDWEKYKAEEGISEELANHNKGKSGYIERQAFLQRTDQRQFEIERSMREKNRKRSFLPE